MPEELPFLSATEAAKIVREAKLSARELTELVLDWIDVVNPKLNAVVELRREAALEEASAADERAAGDEALGPLHGVPITIKEAFNVVGLHTTWGNPAFRECVATWDATVVNRLRRAGAIVVGKSNLAFMLGDFGQSANELYGVTNNPWDTARTPGGSSGGAAAAVAAGLSYLDYGTDLVGSVRIPASFCGIYGLKPSAGIVPLTGVQLPGPAPEPSAMTYLLAAGPLARSASDLRVALKVTGGPEPPTSAAYEWLLPPPRRTRLEDFRVGVVLDHPLARPSNHVVGPLSNTVDALARAGVTIVDGWPDGVDPVRQYECFGFHVNLFFAYQQPAEPFEPIAALLAREHERMAARAAWSRYFEDVDVFLCPSNFTAAFPHDNRPFGDRTIGTSYGDLPYDRQSFWVAQPSLPGLPVVVAPIGRTDDGLPVGVQIVGPLYEDDTAIAFAELLAEQIGGYTPPPI